MIHLATPWIFKPLKCLGTPNPKVWVRIQLLRAKWSKETRRNSTVYRTTKGLGSKRVRGQEAVLEGADGEAIGAAVIVRKILGVRNGGMQKTHTLQIICTN